MSTEAYTPEVSKRLFAAGAAILRDLGSVVAEVRRAIDARAYLDVKKEHAEAVTRHGALVTLLQELVTGLRPMADGATDVHAWLDALRNLGANVGAVAVSVANRPDLAQRADAIAAGAEDALARAFSPGGLSPMFVGALGLTAIAIGYFVQKQTKPEPRSYEFPKWDFGGETDAEVEADEDGVIG